MTTLSDILNISISRQTAAVQLASFAVPAIIASHTMWTDRARVYTSAAAVLTDFPSGGTVYKAAVDVFAAPQAPTQFVVGRRQVDSVNGSVVTATAGAVYSLTVDGTVYSYTAPASPTPASVVTALIGLYNATPVTGITATDHANGTFTIGVSTLGTPWSLVASNTVVLANVTPTETWATAIAAVYAANNLWYCFGTDSHLAADIEAVAAVAETMKVLYGYSTQDPTVGTNATTDIASVLKASSYTRTFGLWNATADTNFPEFAWIGTACTATPGSNTWAYKTLAGIPVDTLSETFTTYASAPTTGKNISTYETIGGLNVTIGGTVASGEYIDVMVFVDWLQSTMKSRIFFRMANAPKLPYTSSGATVIEAEIRGVLNDGITAGGLSSSPAPTVFMPLVSTVSSTLKATRTYNGITFNATLAGAIHYAGISGTVTV